MFVLPVNVYKPRSQFGKFLPRNGNVLHPGGAFAAVFYEAADKEPIVFGFNAALPKPCVYAFCARVEFNGAAYARFACACSDKFNAAFSAEQKRNRAD